MTNPYLSKRSLNALRMEFGDIVDKPEELKNELSQRTSWSVQSLRNLGRLSFNEIADWLHSNAACFVEERGGKEVDRPVTGMKLVHKFPSGVRVIGVTQYKGVLIFTTNIAVYSMSASEACK